MKKLLLFILTLACTKFIFAQCGTIMVSSTTLQYPDTVTNLAVATQGSSYSSILQFYAPSTYSGYTLNSVTINSINGLPSGFTYTTSPSNGVITGGNSGCIIIQCSNPTAPIGTYPLSINATASIQLIGNISMPVTGYKISIIAAPLLLTSVKNNPLCFGSSNGSLTLTASGGASPYQFRLNSGTYQSSNSFSNLNAGIYTIQVKDSLNTITTKYDTLIDPADLVVGGITGNTSPYVGSTQTYSIASQSNITYSWNIINGSILSGQGTNNISVLWTSSIANGKVLTTITKNTCTKSDSINISTIPLPLVFNTVDSNETCTNSGNGSITITASGGITPYQYRINNGTYQSSNSFSNLSSGVYNIQIKDSLNTTTTKYDTLKTPTQLLMGSISGNNLALVSSIQNYFVSPQNNITYLWSISNGSIISGQGSNSISVQWSSTSGSGKVFLKITRNTCSVSDSISVSILNGVLTFSSIVVNESCPNKKDGSITVNVSGGNAPFRYALDSGIYQSSNVFTGLRPKAYTVNVLDTTNTLLQESDTIKAGLGVIAGIITGDTFVQPYATRYYSIVHQTGLYYTWSAVLGNIATGQGTSTANVNWGAALGNGSIKIRIRNAAGCADSSVLTVRIGTTGINELRTIFPYQLYPNPCSNSINISDGNQSLKNSTVKIYDMLGRILVNELVKADGIVQLNITNLKQGTYIIEVEKDGNVNRSKLMKE